MLNILWKGRYVWFVNIVVAVCMYLYSIENIQQCENLIVFFSVVRGILWVVLSLLVFGSIAVWKKNETRAAEDRKKLSGSWGQDRSKTLRVFNGLLNLLFLLFFLWYGWMVTAVVHMLGFVMGMGSVKMLDSFVQGDAKTTSLEKQWN